MLRARAHQAWNARPATLLFAAAAAASAGVLLLLGSRLTFLLDDWEFLVYRRGFDAEAILAPHGENIAIGPVLVYKALLATAGMESALPFRVVSTAAFIASVALLFVYLRRRVGEWAALAGAVAVLFLGAAWEDLLWPFQVGFFVSMACGLGMLLALDRQDRRGDLAACVLLAGSLAFSSLGLPFAAGAGVAVLLAPAGRRASRAFVFAVPLALFALWWLGWGHDAESAVTANNVASAPLFLFEGLAAAISSLLGLATPRDESQLDALSWGRPLLAAALALAVWRLWRLGAVPRPLIVVGALAATFWLLAGVNEKFGRDPLVSRYQYIGAIFVLLIAAELLRGLRLRRPALVAIFAITALAVFSNLSYLHGGYTGYANTSQLERAGLAAVEIARDRVDPGFTLTEQLVRTSYVHIEAGPYLSAADEFGSPAYTEEELAAAAEPVRQAADVTLAFAVRLGFEIHDSGSPACRSSASLDPQAAAPLELPVGETTLRAGAEPVTVRLQRFSGEGFTAGTIPARGAATLAVPPDRSRRPWFARIDSSAPVTICAQEAA